MHSEIIARACSSPTLFTPLVFRGKYFISASFLWSKVGNLRDPYKREWSHTRILGSLGEWNQLSPFRKVVKSLWTPERCNLWCHGALQWPPHNIISLWRNISIFGKWEVHPTYTGDLAGGSKVQWIVRLVPHVSVGHSSLPRRTTIRYEFWCWWSSRTAPFSDRITTCGYTPLSWAYTALVYGPSTWATPSEANIISDKSGCHNNVCQYMVKSQH